jgi:hypothetical protein
LIEKQKSGLQQPAVSHLSGDAPGSGRHVRCSENDASFFRMSAESAIYFLFLRTYDVGRLSSVLLEAR